ncbi:MAG: SDR family NAD(P)-dependent oxidoreductase [Candidatus Baltobacteraceae bacterium]
MLAADDHDLILVARSYARLEEIAAGFRARYGVVVNCIAKDLSQPDAGLELYEQARHCDVLINNAGFATYGKFAESDVAVELQELQLNIVTLTQLTRLFLPGMIAQKWGRVLNVASTAAFIPGPLMAVYYASKAYVLSFSEAIANELRGTGVTVTCLAPGATQTGFQERAKMGDVPLFRGALADASTVAKAGYRGMKKGKPLVVPGLKNKVLAFSTKVSPRGLMTKISRAANERRE